MDKAEEIVFVVLQAALVVANAGFATRLAALIPLRIAQPICLSIDPLAPNS